jgi:hypothetical protein
MLVSLVSRFRVLIAVLSISISLTVFILANLYYQPHPAGGLRLVDISFWILFIGSVAAGLLDLSLFWKRSPYSQPSYSQSLVRAQSLLPGFSRQSTVS